MTGTSARRAWAKARMADDDLSCSVRFGFQVDCDGDDLDDYVVGVEGVVVAHLEPPEGEPDAEFEEVESGRVYAFVVQTTQAMTDGVSLYDVFDAHSSNLEAAFAALFDPVAEEPKEELEIAPAWEGFLYLDRIVIDPAYRGRGVTVKALEATIRSFCPRGIVAAHQDGMELTIEEWKELGFVKIAGSEVIYRDNASYNPYGPAFEEE
jgi:GNAT superfamily N-acetyltransferase